MQLWLFFGCLVVVLNHQVTSLRYNPPRRFVGNRRASTSSFENFEMNLPTPLKAEVQSSALKVISMSSKIKTAVEKLGSMSKASEVLGMKEEHIVSLFTHSERLERLLLGANLRLVHSIATQHQDQGLDVDDLVSEGVKGLKHAMTRFDPSKGFAFSTYAYPWIREYIRSALAASSLPITLPPHVYRLLIRVRALQQQFAESGRDATDEELAQEMGISMERFDVVKRAMALAARSNSLTSAESMYMSSAGGRIQYEESTWERIMAPHKLGNVVEHVASKQAQPNAYVEGNQGEMRAAVLSALNTLPEDEARAIHERLGLGSLKSNGRTLNYSELERSLGVDSDTARLLYQKGRSSKFND